VHALAEAGIPVGVIAAPVIPGLTDEEIPEILATAAQAGATFAGHAVLRLPHAVKDLFAAWLEQHMPERKSKILARLRSLRGGGLDDARFGVRMRGEGAYAWQIADLFELARRRSGLAERGPELATEAFGLPAPLRDGGQLDLFAR
jgi:DNA repair photolyase